MSEHPDDVSRREFLGSAALTAGGAAAGQFVIVKLRSSGSLDSTFGTSGQVVPALPGSTMDGVRALATFRDGRILAAGTLNVADGTSRMVVLRLLPSGDSDRQVSVRVSLASALRSCGELERCRDTPGWS